VIIHEILTIYIVLELRTFVLENCVKTLYAQCSLYQNEMVRREKLTVLIVQFLRLLM